MIQEKFLTKFHIFKNRKDKNPMCKMKFVAIIYRKRL